MRILILGGTRLVGRQIVNEALARGHDVTLFNRGQTDPAAFPTATRLIGDRNGDLAELAIGEWDATVDVCAYVPRQVRSLLTTLDKRAGHYTFISTISVYDDSDLPESGFTESAPLLEPAWDDTVDMMKYGQLKVACERVAAELAGDRLLIIRPGYVVGPYDYTERFTHWVRAVADGGPIIGPDADQPLQCIDSRDLAAFTVDCVERRAIDTYNVTAPQDVPTFAEVFEAIAQGLRVDLPEVTWTQADDDLPLSAAPIEWPSLRADVSKAAGAGLTWRPLEDTVRDIATELNL
jgi:nucleoside-diphosphate-sugar epimerase